MSTLTEKNTVAEWVNERPGRTRLFEKLGIDFCCGGQKILAEVCAEKGLDAKSIVQTVKALESLEPTAGAQPETDWTKASLTELADHIVQTHHQYLKDEMPRIAQLVKKIASVHGGRHPELHEVERVYGALHMEMFSHMQKEEGVLFPAIRKLDQGTSEFPLEHPIGVMLLEHDSAGHNLEDLNRLTHGYVVPDDGCGTYRAAMEGLKQMESDIHLHIHKENNILFPRAMEAEAARR